MARRVNNNDTLEMNTDPGDLESESQEKNDDLEAQYVMVTFVESPDTVWVVANEEWVEKLQHQYKFHSDSISLPSCGHSLELGEAVVGKMDGVWVRCRVVEVKEDVGTVTVRTMDTG